MLTPATMEECRDCGSPIEPDMDRCGHCDPPVSSDTSHEATRAPLWMQSQRRERVTFEDAVYSRWRPGPTSFGAAGRIAMTILVLTGGVVGYPMIRGWLVTFVGVDAPGRSFLTGYAVVATLVATCLIVQIWKRARVA